MELTYINELGESLTFRQRKPYFLQSIDGTGAVKHIISTFKAPNQDGGVFVSGSLDMRNIVIEGRILASSVDESYELRQKLLNLFNPKAKGRLIFKGLSIPCIVEEAPVFKADSHKTPAFFISILSTSPYFETVEELTRLLAGWHPNFEFELVIPIEEGIEMGYREESLIIPVENVGSVPCGATFEFIAQGIVEDPLLIDVGTGKFIKLNRVMQPGEIVTVSTHFANKRVISSLDGGTNAFSSLDEDSEFLQLDVGTNLLRYDAKVNLNNLEVNVYYRPQYLGV
ncbi:MAG: phage tail family protein [Clostridium sp.]|nr:phage tail family protein [Clostridium sp.]